jgi:hypothetical protein
MDRQVVNVGGTAHWASSSAPGPATDAEGAREDFARLGGVPSGVVLPMASLIAREGRVDGGGSGSGGRQTSLSAPPRTLAGPSSNGGARNARLHHERGPSRRFSRPWWLAEACLVDCRRHWGLASGFGPYCHSLDALYRLFGHVHTHTEVGIAMEAGRQDKTTTFQNQLGFFILCFFTTSSTRPISTFGL